MLLNNGKKRIPIGYEDFKQIIDGQFYNAEKDNAYLFNGLKISEYYD